MFDKIVIPLDGSELAEMALAPALALADKFDASLTLLRVVAAPHAALGTDADVAHDQLLDDIRGYVYEDCRTYLARQQARLTADGYDVQVRLAEGSAPAEAIVRVTEELDAAIIIMSTHGRSGVSRIVFGSVAEKVLRLANVPVLLIRAGSQVE
jgi:nucleotide-binding universal stress UspA family protein